MTMGLVGIAKPPAALLNAGCKLCGLVSKERCAAPIEKGSECARFEGLHIARSSRGTPKDGQRDGLPRLRYFFDFASTSAAGNPHRPAGPIEGALQNIEAVIIDRHVLLNEHCDLRGLRRRSSYGFHMTATRRPGSSLVRRCGARILGSGVGR